MNNTWTLKPTSRRQCKNAVIRAEGKRKTLYVVRCKKRAPWSYRLSRGLTTYLCPDCKEKQEQLLAATQEALKRVSPLLKEAAHG